MLRRVLSNAKPISSFTQGDRRESELSTGKLEANDVRNMMHDLCWMRLCEIAEEFMPVLINMIMVV